MSDTPEKPAGLPYEAFEKPAIDGTDNSGAVGWKKADPPTTKMPTAGQDGGEKCPKCGSANLLGLMGSFWVKIDATGEPIGHWSDFSSETEVTDKRMCSDCDHEWPEGDLASQLEQAQAALARKEADAEQIFQNGRADCNQLREQLAQAQGEAERLKKEGVRVPLGSLLAERDSLRETSKVQAEHITRQFEELAALRAEIKQLKGESEKLGIDHGKAQRDVEELLNTFQRILSIGTLANSTARKTLRNARLEITNKFLLLLMENSAIKANLANADDKIHEMQDFIRSHTFIPKP